MARTLIVLATCAACFLTETDALGQGLLRGLGRELRDRMRSAVDDALEPEENPAPDSPSAQGQPAGPHPTPAGREPGYLGAVVDDRKDQGQGVRILKVRPGSPADRAGLKADDLIAGVAALRVRRMADLAAVLGQAPAGARLTFQILRDGKQRHIDVVLGRQPAAGAQPGMAAPGQPGADDSSAGPILGPPAGGSQPGAAPGAAGDAPPNDPDDLGDEDRARIELLERRLDRAEGRFDRLEGRFDRLEKRIDELESALLDYLKKD